MMKKYLLLSIALFMCMAFAKAQEAPEVQKSLISKIAATWCPPCGGWGWDFFHELEEDNNEQALVMAVHHSGDLVNPAASAITSNFGVNSQPRFVLNNQDQFASSSNTATKRSEIQMMVQSNHTNSPTANTGLEAVLDNGVITVNTNTKFFQDADGEYYLGIYIIEDEVANFQASIGNGAIHTNVLRGGMTADAFGEMIWNGAVLTGTEIQKSFTIDVNANWDLDKVTIASIIWKLENGTYSFVNTNSTNTFEEPQPSSISNITSTNWTMKVQPTVSTGDAVITIDLQKASNNFQLTVFNQIGSAVATLHDGVLASGLHTFALNQELPRGIYLVRTQSGEKTETKRLIVQ